MQFCRILQILTFLFLLDRDFDRCLEISSLILLISYINIEHLLHNWYSIICHHTIIELTQGNTVVHSIELQQMI